MARALCEARILPFKELFESFEFFERVRRRLRAPHVADLCAGHGLTGLLFAVFEPGVERVTCLDKRPPASVETVLNAVCGVAPWARDKVQYVRLGVRGAHRILPHGASVVAIHACGARTDRSLETAMALDGAVAVMPCCYHHTARRAPRALKKALGAAVATDVARTYRLEGAGYDVDWAAIPEVITPMNRILVGTRAS